MILDGKSLQECPVNTGFPQDSILGSTLFLLYINDFPDGVIFNITIYADTTLYSKYDQTYDFWQQLELASELEYDLQDTVDWVRKCLVDFDDGKTQLILFDRYSVAIENLSGKSSFKMLGLSFYFKLDWDSYIFSIVKSASKKFGTLVCPMKFIFPEVALYLYKCTIRLCMEYCCHFWAGTPSCYLDVLDKQVQYSTVGPTVPGFLEMCPA